MGAFLLVVGGNAIGLRRVTTDTLCDVIVSTLVAVGTRKHCDISSPMSSTRVFE
jgi:hypothetical protein